MVEENADPTSNLPKVFTELSTSLVEYVTEFHLNVIEQFTLKAYRSTAKSLHEARFNVIKNELPETFRKLPPSTPALSKHISRSALIAGHLWYGAKSSRYDLPPYTNFGSTLTMMPIPSFQLQCRHRT